MKLIKLFKEVWRRLQIFLNLETNTEIWIHDKTGNEYEVLDKNICNTTNKDDGTVMVLYQHSSIKYIREKVEFLQKFTYKG